MLKKDFFNDQTFIDDPGEKIIIRKEAKIYAGILPRLEANGKSKTLPNKIFAIGRDKRNAVIIADTKVSKFHALITFKDGTGYIRDSNSTNGTFINGQRIEPNRDIKLNNKDVIIVGNTKIMYYI
jgi:pSer/pThr/pTyr-binding forkhead associated (FHA) protein